MPFLKPRELRLQRGLEILKKGPHMDGLDLWPRW